VLIKLISTVNYLISSSNFDSAGSETCTLNAFDLIVDDSYAFCKRTLSLSLIYRLTVFMRPISDSLTRIELPTQIVLTMLSPKCILIETAMSLIEVGLSLSKIYSYSMQQV
jgi:hypothetical protein